MLFLHERRVYCTGMNRLLRFAVFFGIVAVILLIADFAILNALLSVLGAGAAPASGALYAVLAFASLSFIASSIIGRYSYNRFTRAYYGLSAIWIGYLFYLFAASVVYALIALVVGPAPLIGLACLLTAVALGTYGLYHAAQIKVTEVTVSLPGLPTAWRGRRALWVSDIHLGQHLGVEFSRRLVRQMNALEHDIVFVGGDLFDGTGAPDIGELVAPFGALTAPLGIYFITGNHEEFDSAEPFLIAVRAAGLRPLIDEAVDIDGVRIIGVDYASAASAERFGATLARLKSSSPSILLKHEPRDVEIAAKAGVSLMISGHTHRAQMWPLEYVARRVYGAFACGLQQCEGTQVYTSSGAGTWGPPMRVGTDSEIVRFTFR